VAEEQEPSVDDENRVAVVAVGTSGEQLEQATLARPEEHSTIEQAIPVFDGEAVTQCDAELLVGERAVVAQLGVAVRGV
jgi:hypothetical protein